MTSVCIIFPADPVGVVPGGIDTFIRGILKWAPEDIEISLVGVTTDQNQRPVGRWTECDLGRRKYRFYAAATYDDPSARGRVPLSVRFMWGLIKTRVKLKDDILEFHRIEPSLLYYLDSRPKNAFFHQNMQVLHNSNSDILWSKLPRLYFWVQDKLMSRLDSVYAVRRDAVRWYQERYNNEKDKFRFVPTWYDPDTFHPVDENIKSQLRARFDIDEDTVLLITVGRLDAQKNPVLLAKSLKKILKTRSNVHLFYVGDGVLRNELENTISENNLSRHVSLLGLKSPREISELLQAADLFVLSSAYEGMPMCVIEALGSGCPVVTTDVGEVGLVVKPGINGEIVNDHDENAFARAIDNAIENISKYSGIPCTKSVEKYTPEIVLAPVYDNYRHLASRKINNK